MDYKPGNREQGTGNRKFKIFLLLIPLVFLAGACNKKAAVNSPPVVLFGTGTVTIAGRALNVEVAQTPQALQRGLGGRDFLAENSGMLFLFSNPGKVAFWMKDTLIPLDFIWIKDGKVSEITQEVQPEPNVEDASLRRYLPADIIDSVIEVNAGWAAKNKLKVGDSVIINTGADE